MSKNLRMFFLSVLVVIFSLSSVIAASADNITITADGDTEYYSFTGNTLTIRKDGTFVFDNPTAVINSIAFEDDYDAAEDDPEDISNVVINLPRPNPDVAGNGTTGDWAIDFMGLATLSDGTARTSAAKITIGQANVHSALLFTSDEAVNWVVPAYVDFTLDAPIRVYDETVTEIKLNVTVNQYGKMTFGKDGQIFGDPDNNLVATGYVTTGSNETDVATAVTYNITNGGEMEIQNQYAIRGKGLEVNVAAGGTLTLNMLDGTSTLDLRGTTETDTANGESDDDEDSLLGANLTFAGTADSDATIKVLRSLTLRGYIRGAAYVTKSGAGTLTLEKTKKWPTLPVFHTPTNLEVSQGGLLLSGDTLWSIAAETTVTVSGETAPYPFFTANEKSIENTDTFNIVLGGHGTATFRQHSIYNGNEIYPYDDFINKQNGLTINVENVNVTVGTNATLIIDNGAFLASTIAGEGTINIVNDNVSTSPDKAVLILTPDSDTSDFTGTITGSANVGLYAPNTENNTFTASTMLFQEADLTLDNLIVYGPAVLVVDENADLSKVSAIWLRSNRPGADNTKTATANSMIDVGGLKFANVNAEDIDAAVEADTTVLAAQAVVDAADAALEAIDEAPFDADAVTTALGAVTTAITADVPSSADITEAIEAATTALAADDVDAETATTVVTAVVTAANASLAEAKAAVLNTEYDSVIDLTSPDITIKIDGTATANDRAVIELESQVYATIGNLALYVNKDVDFGGAYVAPAQGIYVLTINGTAQPSKLVVEGTHQVVGEGVPADVTNEIYQITMTDKSDVRFTSAEAGKARHPIGANNSLEVGTDGKLEMARGAIIDGHLSFAGSTSKVNDSQYGDDNFPAESWFEANGRWNSPELDTFSTFTTVVAKKNRIDTNTASEYSVFVSGDLTLSVDSTITPGTSAYPGLVLVRTRTHADAFDDIKDTSMSRFRSIGTTNSSSTYTADFLTVYDDMYFWRISPHANSKGVVIETRSNLGLLSIGDFEFVSGADTFGNGSFVAKAPVTAWAKGEQLTITRATGSLATAGYKYILSKGSDRYGVTDAKVYFHVNEEGEDSAMSNVFDEDEWTSTFSSGDIFMQGEFGIDNGTPEVTLTGRSYNGYKFANMAVMLRFTGKSRELELDSIIPAYKEAPLSTEGYGDKYSSAQTYVIGNNTFRIGEDGTLNFAVVGLRKSTYSTQEGPELTDKGYVWNVKVVEDTFFIPDENGLDTKLSNIKLVRFDGATLSEAEPTDTAEDPVITYDGDHAVVTVPVSALGNTGDEFVATKWLALRGDKADGSGTLTTAPVAFTLITAMNPEDIITDTGSLNQTVQIGGNSVSGIYDINPDDLSGDITLVPVNLPTWLGFNGRGETIAYQTGDLTGTQPGVYTFDVIAHNGSAHKLYRFTVTVVGEPEPVVPHIEPAEDVTIDVLAGETATSTLTFVSGDSTVATWAIADNTNPDGLLAGSASGNTFTLTINAAGIAVGTYEYTVNVNDGAYSRKVTVVVSAPTFEIEEVYNGFTYFSPVEGHTYYAVFGASGASGNVEWTLTVDSAAKTELKSYHSGDQFVVEGVAVRAQDSDEYDIDQIFTVSATAGAAAADPIETSFTVDAEDEDIAASATALTPASGSNDAVDSTYVVNFPAGVTADVDSVHLPSWLEPVMGTTEDTEDYVVGIKFSKVAGELPNGTKGTVFVEAYDDNAGENVYYKWDVVYNAEPAKLELTLTPAELTVKAGAEGSSAASVTNALGNVKYTLSKDAALTWVTINESTGAITVSAPATEGTYSVTVVAQDDRGPYGEATAVLAITVTPGPTPVSPDVSPDVPGTFTITATPTTVTFASPTASAQTVTLSTNLLGATVTYSATVSPSTGLTASVSGSTLTLTPSAAGSYTVTVTGTNGTRTATTTVSVTVSDGSTPSTFSISATPRTVTFTSAAAAAQTVTLSANLLGATVTYTAEVTSGSEDGLDLDVSGNTLTIDPLLAGSYTVTVTGTNGTRTATTTISVTVNGTSRVSSSGGGCDAGFGALALILAAPLFLRRRRS